MCECCQRSLSLVCWIVLLQRGKVVWGELCCLGHRRKGSAFCLIYKIYHRLNHPMSEYLRNLVAACNTRAAATLDEFALRIQRCRTDQFSLSFLSTVVRLWNVLPSGVFTSGTLGSFKSAVDLRLQRA